MARRGAQPFFRHLIRKLKDATRRRPRPGIAPEEAARRAARPRRYLPFQPAISFSKSAIWSGGGGCFAARAVARARSPAATAAP
jgi:hypothetical protein